MARAMQENKKRAICEVSHETDYKQVKHVK